MPINSEDLQDNTVEQHHFVDELETVRVSADRLKLENIYPVNLDITAELGRKHMLVRDVLDLEVESVLVLEKQAGEMADLAVNGIPFARGEIVVLGDTLHVRIAEILGAFPEEQT